MVIFAAMKWIVTLVAIVAGTLTVCGQSLTADRALAVAGEFFSAMQGAKSRNFAQRGDLEIVASAHNAVMVAERGGGSFTLVCGSDDNPVVAGYGDCSKGTMPEALSDVVRVTKKPFSSVATNVAWAAAGGYQLPILPLVKSVRHQYGPYNNLCPYYIYDDGAVSQERCMVGCVATATEQVVSHYRYPRMLLDSIAGFRSVNNGTQPTIPKGTKIDFDNILDIYEDDNYTEEQALAVAELSYYLGVAAKMDWGVGASGAKIYRLEEPLKRAFGYKYARCLFRSDYSPHRWFELLMNELSAGRPIAYAGYVSSGGGHAFVVDGINVDGYFHITWGYGGQYDGYFDLSVLMPQENPLEPTVEGGVAGLSHLQQALFLYPDSVEYVTDDTLALEHRVEIDTVIFNRAPDTNMYVTAEVKVRNISDTDVWWPVELFTYSAVDADGMPADMDFLGVADGLVKAGADTTLLAYVQFVTAGDLKLGLNTLDSLYLDFDRVVVARASQPKLEFELTATDIDAGSASFSVAVRNCSDTYWSGRRLIYSLFEGPYTPDEGDWRHFTILNLAPLAEIEDVVEFGHLKPNTDYTFVVRNSWLPALQYSFTTPDPTGVTPATADRQQKSKKASYILNNRITIEYDESAGNYRQVLRPRR